MCGPTTRRRTRSAEFVGATYRADIIRSTGRRTQYIDTATVDGMDFPWSGLTGADEGQVQVKGIIFNAVEEAVRADHGEDLWDQLLDEAGAEGAYTSLGTYSDTEFEALVDSASRLLAIERADLLRHLGRRAFPYMALRNRALVAAFRDARSLLLGLNGVIHPEVLKLYPGAEVPTFEVEVVGDDLGLLYRSRRGLCFLGEGLAVGAAEHFGETVTARQDQCQREGAPACRIVITWTGVP